MTSVVDIRGSEKVTVADCIGLPEDLELLAQRIRNGEVNAERAMIVWQGFDGIVRHVALGPAITGLEAMGLLAWGMDQIREKI